MPAASFELRLAEARPALLAFARQLARDEAEDLCQDVLARALRYRKSFDARLPLLPWLRTSLLRERVDQARRRAQEARELAYEGEPASPAADPREDPGERVRRLLETLEPLDAQLLRGFHLEERSIAELAHSTGLAEGSVRSRLHRARQRLATQRNMEDE